MARIASEHLNIRIEPEKKKKLEDLASLYGVSASQMVAYMIDYMDKKKPNYVKSVIGVLPPEKRTGKRTGAGKGELSLEERAAKRAELMRLAAEGVSE